MLVIILVSTGLMRGFFLQVNGQCTTPGCKGFSGGTDKVVEEVLEDNDHKLHGIYKSLLKKIEKNDKDLESSQRSLLKAFSEISQRMDKIYLSAKYKDLKYTVCPPGFQYLPGAGGCFQVLFQPLTWAKAVDECKALQPGAHLTAITSAAKQQAIKEFLEEEFKKPGSDVCVYRENGWIGDTSSVWISAQRQDPRRCDPTFIWRPIPSAEIPFVYNNWMQVPHRGVQPDCHGQNESCAQIYKKENYAWNDANCESQVCPLCEI